MVRSEISKPGLSNSPWMRGAPPERIRLLHLANQLTDLLRHTRSSRLSPALPTLPTPVAPETLTMPGHDGLGSDNVNDRAPTGSAVRQQDPERAIGLAQARPSGASLIDRSLLAKREILKDEAPAAGKRQVEPPNEPENKWNVCPVKAGMFSGR